MIPSNISVLVPPALLLISSITAPILRERRSLTYTSILSAIACSAMIYISTYVLTTGEVLVEYFDLYKRGESLPIPAMLNFAVDPLSAFFILVLGIVGLTSSIYSIAYMTRYLGVESLRFYSFIYPTFLGSMYMVLVSFDLVWFIVFWELMTLSAFFLISFERENPIARKAALKYLMISYSGSGFLIAALITLAFMGGSTSFTALQAIAREVQSSPHTFYMIVTFLIVGLGVKAALVPMHVWLPDAHSEAPSNISALLSGVMVKMAIYGFLRFLTLLSSTFVKSSAQTSALGVVGGLVVATLGTLSLIVGSFMALKQLDIKRLMAYSTIAHIGYICLGIGAGITLLSFNTAQELNVVGVYAIGAGVFHTLNHAIFKSLLFMVAGCVIYATSTRDLKVLGGLARRMPLTFIAALIASLAISGVPPLNGFVSKWLIISTNLASGHALLSLFAAIALLASAMTAALYIKFISLAFLSNPRSDVVRSVNEVPFLMALPMLVLASLCLILGLLSYIPYTTIINVISSTLEGYGVAVELTPITELTAPFMTITAILLIVAVASGAVVWRISLYGKMRLTTLWTFGTKDLIPSTLSLKPEFYYTEFERVYDHICRVGSYIRRISPGLATIERTYYKVRSYIYRAFIDPLISAFLSVFTSYDSVDTYLYNSLVVITAFLLSLMMIFITVIPWC